MSISIPEEKCGKTRTLASRYQFGVTLRQLASFIGLLVSHKNGYPYAPLHYRNLQLFYGDCLKVCKGDDLVVTLSVNASADISW